MTSPDPDPDPDRDRDSGAGPTPTPPDGGAANRVHPIRTLVDGTGTVLHGVERGEIERRLQSQEFFWLDLPQLGDEELTWLRDVFKFHPLAIEDVENFGQRPKLEEYDGYVLLVLYGSASPLDPNELSRGRTDAYTSTPEDLEQLAEVHCFLAEHYLVTVHRSDCLAFSQVADRLRTRHVTDINPSKLIYRVADSLVDSFFPVLAALDDRIDTLQAEVLRRPTDREMGELLDYKSALIALRRVVTPQRDMFAGISGGAVDLPGLGDEEARYFRDIYDHLIRLSDLIDSYRDLLSSTTDAYLSVVSNRLNEVMKQLTIIATIFLPLSFLTGFFGQNFGWMVTRLGSLAAFLGLAIGLELVAAVGLVMYFYRKGWVGGDRP